MLTGDHDLEHPAEKPPRRVEAGDDRRQVLAEAQVHIAVAAVAGGEDQGMHHPPPPGFPVLQQAHLPEVDLAFRAWLAVSDPHRGLPGGAPVARDLQRVPVQRPLGNHHAPAGQQLTDLHHRQALVQEALDLLMMGRQHRPALPVTAGAVRADPLSHRADQRIAQLPLTPRAIQPARLRHGHVPADGLAVQPRSSPASRSTERIPSPCSHSRNTSRISCT
jgi:hypothetical protein